MPRSWQILLLTSAAAFLGFLDATIVNIAFPSIERAFPGASRAGLSWVLSAYNVVFAALLVPAGRMADVLGRRRLFLAGVGLFTGASALCGFAPSPETLVAARVIQAVGAAMLLPSAQALLLAAFPASRRATAIGLWGAAGAVAAATGPSLGGALIEVADWRLVFLVNLPIGLAVFAFGWRLLPETRKPTGAESPDILGALLVIAAIGPLALAIIQGRQWGWSSSRILASFAGFAVLLPLFIRRSLRHPRPAVDLSLFRVRSFAAANAGTLLFAAGFFGLLLANALFLQTVWGYSVLITAFAMTPGPLIAALVAGPAGRVADRYGQRVVTVPGTLVFALASAWYALAVGDRPAYLSEWLPGAVLSGAGIGLAFPALGSAAAASLSSTRFGVGSAIVNMMRQVGAVLGVAILVAIVGTPALADAPAAFDAGWTFTGLCALAACGASLALGRVRVRGAREPRPDTLITSPAQLSHDAAPVGTT